MINSAFPCKNVLSVNVAAAGLPKKRTVARTQETEIACGGSTVAGDRQDFELAALVALETQEERMK
jgi:hypothetical protein